MKRLTLSFLLFIFFFLSGNAQETWYGEIALSGGGGINDIYRFNEPMGAASFSGNGFFSGGLRVRRIIRDWLSVESGVNYAEQYYTMHSAPMPESVTQEGHFGMVTLPVVVRFDFLKYLFTDVGVLAGMQTGSYGADNLSGLGFTAGVGVDYKFKSDIIITARVFSSQLAVVHFMPEEYPHSLSNTGFTIGIGYEFIRLGKCHCPEGNQPKRKFF